MVLATTWVRRGVAAQFPTKYEIDEAELGRISKLARLQLEDAQDDLDDAQGTVDAASDSEDAPNVEKPTNETAVPSSRNEDELAEYNLDDYDDEPTDEQGEKFAMFGNANSLAYHTPN
jgi:periodic tryptophan protein 1